MRGSGSAADLDPVDDLDGEEPGAGRPWLPEPPDTPRAVRPRRWVVWGAFGAFGGLVLLVVAGMGYRAVRQVVPGSEAAVEAGSSAEAIPAPAPRALADTSLAALTASERYAGGLLADAPAGVRPGGMPSIDSLLAADAGGSSGGPGGRVDAGEAGGAGSGEQGSGATDPSQDPGALRRQAYEQAKLNPAGVLDLRGATPASPEAAGAFPAGRGLAPAAAIGPAGGEEGVGSGPEADPASPEAQARLEAEARRAAAGGWTGAADPGAPGLPGGVVTSPGGGGRAAEVRSRATEYGRMRTVPRGTLRKGTVIPAVLATAIHTGLPGNVVARVTRDVLDSRGRCVLIPQDALLYGTVGDQLAVGQNRGAVAWTEVQLDGERSLDLPGLPHVDRTGAPGVQGTVSHHYGRVFGAALLLSAVGAGVRLAGPSARAGAAYPSAGEAAAGEVATELGRVATEFLRRNTDVRPTLRVPANTEVLVLVNRDLVVGGRGC